MTTDPPTKGPPAVLPSQQDVDPNHSVPSKRERRADYTHLWCREYSCHINKLVKFVISVSVRCSRLR
jgi:hypothetical protein